MRTRAATAIAVLLFPVTGAGCDRLRNPSEPSLPDSATIAGVYAGHGVVAEYRYSGNVVEMVVQQPPEQLRRGGELWARVGPYIYLFTPATRALLDNYPAVGGVRAITMATDVEVARALLVRDTMNEQRWRRAHALLAEALEQGTARPGTMDRLARFGEQYARYQYNTHYVPPRPQ